MPLPLSKVIDLEDFESPELRPYLREINEQEAARFGSAPDDIVPDSKQWECAMALRVLDRNGFATSGRMVAGIGAGTEATIFALARRGCLVFPVDLYLQRTVWSDVAPAGMLIDPSRYCVLDVPQGHIIPVHSSALKVNLPSNSFDAVFSSGSIEHFGSLDNVALAAREIGRILKPGGVASIATEFRLDGPDDRRWFDDNVILFTPQLLERYIVEPSGLVLREPLAVRQSDTTFETRHNLVDFLQRAQIVHGIEEKRAVYPNLVLYHEGFLFCSVVLTLYKDRDVPDTTQTQARARAEVEVAEENAALSAALERFQRTPDQPNVPAESHALFGEVARLRAEADWLRAEYERSNAWKKWTAMRPARFVYRRIKRWRG
jgi:SAM-dependent methyltransferase